MNNDQQNNKIAILRKNSTIYSAICAGLLLFIAAIVMIVLAANGAFSSDIPTTNVGENSNDKPSASASPSASNSSKPDDKGEEKVDNTYFAPVETMTLMNEHGFYFNSTLNCYYEHMGIDVTAEEGDGVFSIASGTVESILVGDLLQGAEVVIDHGNGAKCIYRYVEPLDTLKEGDKVLRGQKIATVAAPAGSEYKDGAHLHLELCMNDKTVDPAEYFTLAEK